MSGCCLLTSGDKLTSPPWPNCTGFTTDIGWSTVFLWAYKNWKKVKNFVILLSVKIINKSRGGSKAYSSICVLLCIVSIAFLILKPGWFLFSKLNLYISHLTYSIFLHKLLPRFSFYWIKNWTECFTNHFWKHFQRIFH